MTAITVTVPPEVLSRIDELRQVFEPHRMAAPGRSPSSECRRDRASRLSTGRASELRALRTPSRTQVPPTTLLFGPLSGKSPYAR
jgi:hypothetical protein